MAGQVAAVEAVCPLTSLAGEKGLCGRNILSLSLPGAVCGVSAVCPVDTRVVVDSDGINEHMA